MECNLQGDVGLCLEASALISIAHQAEENSLCMQHARRREAFTMCRF